MSSRNPQLVITTLRPLSDRATKTEDADGISLIFDEISAGKFFTPLIFASNASNA